MQFPGLFVVAASLVLCVIGVVSKSMVEFASPVFLFSCRSFLCFTIAAPALGVPRLSTFRDRNLLFRAIFAAFGMGLYFSSLVENPLILATAFVWTAPFFNLVLQRKRIRLSDTYPILLTVTFVFMNRSMAHALTLRGLGIGVLSSFFIGASYFFLSEAVKKWPPEDIESSFLSKIACFSAPMGFSSLPHRGFHFGAHPLIGLALVTVLAIFYQKLTVAGYKRCDPLRMIRRQSVWIPIFSVLFDVVFFRARYSLVSCVFLLMGLVLLEPRFERLLMRGQRS